MDERVLNGDLTAVSVNANYSTIENLKQYGSGVAANIIGVPYKVYRVGPKSSGDFIQSANLIADAFPLYRRRNRDRDGGLETDRRTGTFNYEMLGDFSDLRVGDCLIQNDPVYGAGFTQVTYPTVQYNGICLATDGVLKKPIGARLDRNVKIFRPTSSLDADGYMDSSLDSALVLVLECGKWSFQPEGSTPSLVPSGFLPGKGAKGAIFPNVPDTTAKVWWSVYLPPLEGYLPREGDRLVSQEGDRYVIQSPWQQLTGFAGYQLVVEREISQP